MPEFRLSAGQTIFSDGALYFAHEAAKAALDCVVWIAPDEVDKTKDVSKELAFSVAMDVADYLSIPEVTEIVRKRALTPADIGHNLYLSAHGEGTGFWDRGWGEDGMVLHEKASSFPRYVYVNEDGQLASE